MDVFQVVFKGCLIAIQFIALHSWSEMAITGKPASSGIGHTPQSACGAGDATRALVAIIGIHTGIVSQPTLI